MAPQDNIITLSPKIFPVLKLWPTLKVSATTHPYQDSLLSPALANVRLVEEAEAVEVGTAITEYIAVAVEYVASGESVAVMMGVVEAEVQMEAGVGGINGSGLVADGCTGVIIGESPVVH